MAILGNDGQPAVRVETEEQAYLSVLLLCSKSDGYIGEHEMDDLEQMIMLKEIFAKVESPRELINICFDNVQQMKGKREELMDLCVGKITNREGLFASCVELVLSDGFVGESEKAFIEMLYRKLGISQERAETIIGVLSLKSK